MKVEEYKPNDLLAPFIKSYIFIESREELINRVLPGTSFALAFRIRGSVSYLNQYDKTVLPSATFSGLRKTVRLINYTPQTAMLIIRFRETGVQAFFRQPLHELFETSISLDHLYPQSEISILEERLAEVHNNPDRISVIEHYFCSKLLYNKPDGLVSEAVRKIYLSKGMTRISELSDVLCISQDAFEKRFRKVTGSTPKQFSSIVRMDAIVRQNARFSSLLSMALDSGYYDQAHFNKDFKLFTGQSPTEFFKSSSFW